MCGHRRYEYRYEYVSRSHDETVSESAHIRASQAEREHTVERLRVHASEGRLEIDELEERVEAAYAAKTRGDLNELLSDLPEPAPRRSTHRARHDGVRVPGFMPLVLAIAVFVLAPATVVWLGWVLLAWWFFGSHAPSRGFASYGPRPVSRAAGTCRTSR